MTTAQFFPYSFQAGTLVRPVFIEAADTEGAEKVAECLNTFARNTTPQGKFKAISDLKPLDEKLLLLRLQAEALGPQFDTKSITSTQVFFGNRYPLLSEFCLNVEYFTVFTPFPGEQ